MTEDSRSLADQARDTIHFIDREISQAKDRPSGAGLSAAVLVARSNLAIALAILAHADAVRQSAPVAAAPLRTQGRKTHRTTMPLVDGPPVGNGRPTGDPVPLETEPEEAGTRYYLKDGELHSDGRPAVLPPFPPGVFRNQD